MSPGLKRGIRKLVRAARSAITPRGPKRLYVNASAAAGGDGSSWSRACRDFQDAIDRAGAATEIWVARGVYRPGRGAADREASFELKARNTWLGGFAGGETRADQRDPERNQTILDGILEPDRADASPRTKHIVISRFGVTGVIDGFIVQNGESERFAGGMLIHHGNPTVRNCTFRYNSAYAAGAVFNWRSRSTFDGCRFIENYAPVRGAGLYSVESFATIVNCVFERNRSDDGGAGLAMIGGDPKVTDCQFVGNVAGEKGAGASNVVSTPTFTRCLFRENKSPDGAGYYHDSSVCTLIDCVFESNESDDGAALYVRYGFPEVTGCRFMRNRAKRGAAFFNLRGRAELSNVKIVENHADSGSAIFGDATSSASVRDSVIWANEGGEAIAGPGEAVITGSHVQGGFAGEGNSGEAPPRESLASLGAP